jgi:hypothetical protein
MLQLSIPFDENSAKQKQHHFIRRNLRHSRIWKKWSRNHEAYIIEYDDQTDKMYY